MVVVDGSSYVMSEKLANLLPREGFTGYRLEPVVHRGPEKGWRPAYQLLPTSTLPPRSSVWAGGYFNRPTGVLLERP